jgi:hypothetical protein
VTRGLILGAHGQLESSDLDYTVLRPGWFTQDEEISYRLMQKGEPFKGHDVSLKSLSDLIVKLTTAPGLHVRQSPACPRHSAAQEECHHGT